MLVLSCYLYMKVATEAYLGGLMKDAIALSRHAKRNTVFPKDIQLVRCGVGASGCDCRCGCIVIWIGVWVLVRCWVCECGLGVGCKDKYVQGSNYM